MFQKIAVSALIAGFGAGIIAAALQYVFVQPLLLHAELFETNANTPLDMVAVARGTFDVQREGLNVVFSALIYTGYAFVLLAAMVWAEERGQPITPRAGILWGAAGFLTMHMAPAFGLAPDMPGLNGADVEARQIWWYGTAACTGIALWLIAFGRNWAMWGAAIVLLAAPHLIGAPQPDMLTQVAPPELAASFAARTLGVALVVWTSLGLLLGAVWHSKLAED
jgi:cobalt transporter subunit CbtA